MKVLVSLKDSKSRVHGSPVLSDSVEMAKRMFAAMVNASDSSMVALYPADFDLFEVGEFDEDKGTIQSLIPIHIANGLDVKVQ